MPVAVAYASGSPGTGTSRTTFEYSPYLLVKPQAMWPLLPATSDGVPGNVTPTSSNPSAAASTRRDLYHVLGTRSPKCMSFAINAAPWAVLDPATAQLLLPAGSSGRASVSGG